MFLCDLFSANSLANLRAVCLLSMYLVSGLWLEAAQLIWASLVGFYSLPQPDKKVKIRCDYNILVTVATSSACKHAQHY